MGAGGNVEEGGSVLEASEVEELGELVEVDPSVLVAEGVVELLLLVEEPAELLEDGGVVEELELEDSDDGGVSVEFDGLLSSAVGTDGAPLQSTR